MDSTSFHYLLSSLVDFVRDDREIADASGIWLEVAFFLFFMTLLIWPPEPLIASGLTFESLHEPLLSELLPSTEVLRHWELLVRFNRLLISLPPPLFVTFLVCSHGGHLVFEVLSIAAALPVMYHAFRVIAHVFRCRKEDAKFTLTGIDAASHLPRFVSPVAHGHDIFVMGDFLLDARRFGLSLERLDDLAFAVVQATPAESSLDEEVLTIRATHLKIPGRAYTFPTQASLLDSLREIVPVEWACERIEDRFILTFLDYIALSPAVYVQDEGEEPREEECFGCCLKRPDVVIRKNCTDSDCVDCSCSRAVWCAACLARVFLAAQPADRPQHWLDGKASCPTCRATFCANDVRLIGDPVDL